MQIFDFMLYPFSHFQQTFTLPRLLCSRRVTDGTTYHVMHKIVNTNFIN